MKLFFVTIFLFGCQNTDSFLYNDSGDEVGTYSCITIDEQPQIILHVDGTYDNILLLSLSATGDEYEQRGKVIRLNLSAYDDYSSISIYPVENCNSHPNLSDFETQTTTH
jgi:hypothetical protein